jgi:hypothetical protein
MEGFKAVGLDGDVVRAGEHGWDVVLARPLEETVRVALVSAFCTTTLACGTGRWEGSVISPEISAFCASNGATANIKRIGHE